jgi:hypothetical protein
VLSFLAFKNDVGFWKGRESVAGLSSRSVVFHAFASTVIFLYLADFSTSLIVLATSGVGAVIDCWKVGISAHQILIVFIDNGIDITGINVFF